MKFKKKLWIVFCIIAFALTQQSFSLSTNAASNEKNIPAYNGSAYTVMNHNNPKFSAKSKKNKTAFENYSKLDKYGRCGVAYANICKKIMPTAERNDISSIYPSGWHSDMNWERCHLIAYQLSGENANAKNLITGTHYFNVTGMLPFENMVADYVDETNNHVLYRVTPIFKGKNKVASGVQMEAWSVEDKGDGICFNVFVHNVTPGVKINYRTGVVSVSHAKASANNKKKQSHKSPSKNTTNKSTGNSTYILNPNTHKFHYSNCRAVQQMKEKNKIKFKGSRKEAMQQGYAPCKICNP